uniref:Uncharacterized protein n=1 Tax=Rhizophora mucronata TaxID=61149 RepID=A0A2P2NH83_RHIMU
MCYLPKVMVGFQILVQIVFSFYFADFQIVVWVFLVICPLFDQSLITSLCKLVHFLIQ